MPIITILMRFLIFHIFLFFFLGASLSSSAMVLCKNNTKTLLSQDNKSPFKVPDAIQYLVSKEFYAENNFSETEEDFINNQILLGLNPPRISVRFLSTNILFTSVFVNILSPPPKR